MLKTDRFQDFEKKHSLLEFILIYVLAIVYPRPNYFDSFETKLEYFEQLNVNQV